MIVLGARIADADLQDLCARLGERLRSCDAPVVVCDVRALVSPDADAIDALARLALTARRLGRRVALLHACGRLRELVSLTGLCDVLPARAALRPRTLGEAEQREQERGVEEEADAGDPAG